MVSSVLTNSLYPLSGDSLGRDQLQILVAAEDYVGVILSLGETL